MWVSRMEPDELKRRVAKAVAHFWRTRARQADSQRRRGVSDQGTRSAVTGGAQMDGLVELIGSLISNAGIPDASIHRSRLLELPGFFRPTKEWDIVVVADGRLLAAVEAKSQVGPSFGNNFNNRTEEALGSAVDIWTAFREGAFQQSCRPWLGYVFLLESCTGSQSPVKVKEPHFKVLPEFPGSSYARRYELFCRKLVRERHYDAAAFLTSDRESGKKGIYLEPASDLAFTPFAVSLTAHAMAFADIRAEQ